MKRSKIADPGTAISALAPYSFKALVEALGHGAERDRYWAADMLGWVDYKFSSQAVAPLLEASRSGDARMRGIAALSLARIGYVSVLPKKRLTELLDDDDLSVRVRAASGLWHLERKPGPVLDVFTGGAQGRRRGDATAGRSRVRDHGTCGGTRA